MTEPNAELAYRVLDHIDQHPQQWDQSFWITQPDGAGCGTAGCFAGWTVMLSGDEPVWGWDGAERTTVVRINGPSAIPPVEVLRDTGTHYWIGERAAELLGISEGDADELFDAGNDREELGKQVARIFGPRTCANCPDGYDCERGEYATVPAGD